jgi:ribose/xylose/arabinose/galactoside ABC-type transport system permease subunit
MNSGGTSLAGGRGTIIGTAMAALLLATLNTGLQIAGVDPTWYPVFVGASILGAVAFHQWSESYVEVYDLGASDVADSDISPSSSV